MHTAPPGSCVRDFSVPEYTPTIPFTVSLDCHVDPDAPSAFTVVVDDTYPTGWTVVSGSISDGGVEIAGTVKWFFLLEEDRTLTYSILPPASESGTKLFSGTIFADGDAGGTHMPIGGSLSIDRTENSCTRSFAVPEYTPGASFKVSLDCSVDPTLAVPAVVVVDETVPDGWAIGDISHAGLEIDGTIKWFALGAENVVLTYSVTPPVPSAGLKFFSGTMFLDDPDSSPVAIPIGGDQSIDTAVLKLYWTDVGAGRIRRSRTDGSGIETLVARALRDRNTVSDFRGPQGVAIHAESAKMFWIDIDPDSPGLEVIQRANLNGSNIEDIITTETFGTRDLIIAFGMLYWYNLYTGEIRRSNIDGTGIEAVRFVLSDEEGWHVGLAADEFEGRLYIALGRRIISTDPDGNKPLHIIDLGKRSRVRGLAVDPLGGKLYWADGGADAIRRSDLSGFNLETLADGILNPQRVVVDPAGGKVYWTDSGPRYAGGARVMRSDPDGSNAETIVRTQDLPQAIALGPDLAPFPLPLPLTELEATPVSPFQIDLSWNDGSDDEDGFEVERALDPAGPFLPIIPAPPNPTSTAEYEDLALDPVTEYCYRVRAFNTVGKSDWSNVACATTLGLATAPPQTTTVPPPIATTTVPAVTSAPPAAATTAPPAEVDVSVWGDSCDCDPAPSICAPAPGRATFQLSVASDGRGRTIPEPGLTTRHRGSIVRLTALPATGSKFLLWRIAEPAHSFFSEIPDIANSTDPSVTLTVKDDIDVIAVFVEG